MKEVKYNDIVGRSSRPRRQGVVKGKSPNKRERYLPVVVKDVGVRVSVQASENNTRAVASRYRLIQLGKFNRRWYASIEGRVTAGRRYKGAKRKGLTAARDVGRALGVSLARKGVGEVRLTFIGRLDKAGAVAKGLLSARVRVRRRENNTPRPHGGCTLKKRKR